MGHGGQGQLYLGYRVYGDRTVGGDGLAALIGNGSGQGVCALFFKPHRAA